MRVTRVSHLGVMSMPFTEQISAIDRVENAG